MRQAEVLVRKLVAVDGLSTGSVVVGEIASLIVRRHASEQGLSWDLELDSPGT